MGDLKANVSNEAQILSSVSCGTLRGLVSGLNMSVLLAKILNSVFVRNLRPQKFLLDFLVTVRKKLKS
jgi:hypothetical protein